MAWKKYTPVVPVKGPAPVSITIPEPDSNTRPFLMIDAATLKKLAWTADTSLQLLIGEYEHAGKIKIEPMAGEPTRLRLPAKNAKARRARIVVGRMPCLVDDEAFKSPLAFEIEGETGGNGKGGATLVVTLPDDARSHRLPARTAAAVAAASGKK
jgi:hypothetical protein